MLKLELKRGLKRKTFIFAFLLFLTVTVFDCIKYNYSNIISAKFINENFLYDVSKGASFSPFGGFFVFRTTSLSNLLFILMPVLVAMGYSDSYLEDMNSGFLKSILIRASKKTYLISKYLANFIIAGITTAVPLLIDLIIIVTTQPAIKPDMFSSNTFFQGSMAVNLYMNHPIIFILLWIFIYFMFSGAIASITLAFSNFIRNKFIVVILPFIILQAYAIIGQFIDIYKFDPNVFLKNPSYGYLGCVFITFIVMMVITFIPYYLGGRKNEIF